MATSLCHGYSLVEFLIYFALSFFLVTLVMQLVVSFEQKIIAQQREAMIMSTFTAGLENFSHLCRQAPAELKNWLYLKPEKISWVSGNRIVQFVFKNKRLVRKEFAKDINGAVHSYARSLLLAGVEGSFLIDVNKDWVMCVHIIVTTVLASKKIQVTKDIYLANGLII